MMGQTGRSGQLLLIGGLPTASRRIGGELEKNRQLLMGLNRLGVDTRTCNVSDWRSRPLATGLALVRLIWTSPQIILSVSTGGLFALALSPFCVMLRRRRVCVMAIGGDLDQSISRLRPRLLVRMIRFLRSVDLIVVELGAEADAMRHLGLTSVLYLPNFRASYRTNQDAIAESQEKREGLLRCVFLSRVTETKGISDAMTAVAMFQGQAPSYTCTLDVYGPLENMDVASLSAPGVLYKGVLSPDKVAECLTHYDVMLFPTFHDGEGFPGVLVDAAFAGLPAIVTAWHSNAEIITDGINGFVVPIHNPRAILEKLLYLANNPEALERLRVGALQRASRYDSAVVVPQLLTALEQKGWTLKPQHPVNLQEAGQ